METEFKRHCPKCDKIIYHKSKASLNIMEKHGSLCRSCGCNDEKRLKHMSEINSGKNNPFFGKKHSEEIKKKLSDVNFTNGTIERLKEFNLQGLNIRSGNDNGMFAKTFCERWKELYGEEIANLKFQEWTINHTKSCKRGSEHYMYGKTPPHGCGRGWSGWYKGWFFRSLKELTYMLKVIEPNGYKWRSAETKDLTVYYKDENGNPHSYHADFLLNEKSLIEIKPVDLMNTPTNICKKEFALEFCKNNAYEYITVDIK